MKDGNGTVKQWEADIDYVFHLSDYLLATTNDAYSASLRLSAWAIYIPFSKRSALPFLKDRQV